ncbi:MAG: hypothetical protein KBT11_02715 [Treponema sp.]|nr:hypothetical protein [Candidatus Treponema equifaecale]
MKNKDLNRLLFKILIASIFLFIVSIIFSNQRQSVQKSKTTALLNPKYKAEINSIQIKNRDSEIEIQKKGNLWILTKNETTVLADEKILTSLLENLSKVRTIYEIHNQKSPEYSDKTQIIVKNNNNMSTKLDFYSENSLLNRIEFEFSNQFYETRNDFSQFLTTDINYWSKAELLSEIQNPVSFTLKAQNKQIKKNESSPDFFKIKQDLSSLRHGSIKLEASTKKPDFSITSENGNGRLLTLFFTKLTEDEYLCTTSIIPSPADPTETAFALHSINKSAEISNWTVNRILELFNN